MKNLRAISEGHKLSTGVWFEGNIPVPFQIVGCLMKAHFGITFCLAIACCVYLWKQRKFLAMDSTNVFEFHVTKEKNIERYRIYKNNKPITYEMMMIDLANKNIKLVELFIKLLQDSNFKAYFFETPPVNSENFKEREFEFVLVKAASLENIKPDYEAYSQYFKYSNDVATFPNLGKDALLIVPCPQNKNYQNYSHFANYIRHADEKEMHNLIQTVGKEMIKRVDQFGQMYVWLSTSGSGVSWLHIRLDSRPKYYQYTPFRETSH